MFLFKAVPVSLFCLLVSITFAQPSTKNITAKEAVAEAEKVITDYKDKYQSTAKAEWENGKIQIGSDSLLFTVKVFGEKHHVWPITGQQQR